MQGDFNYLHRLEVNENGDIFYVSWYNKIFGTARVNDIILQSV